MSFIANNLLEREQIIYQAKLHWMLFATALIWIGLGVISWYYHSPLAAKIFAVFTLADVLNSLIRYYTTEYAVTNKRVLGKVGFISRSTIELFLQKVEGMHIQQSILGRIFNYGDLIILGTGGTQDRFGFVSRPLEFRRHIQQQMADLKLVG